MSQYPKTSWEHKRGLCLSSSLFSREEYIIWHTCLGVFVCDVRKKFRGTDNLKHKKSDHLLSSLIWKSESIFHIICWIYTQWSSVVHSYIIIIQLMKFWIVWFELCFLWIPFYFYGCRTTRLLLLKKKRQNVKRTKNPVTKRNFKSFVSEDIHPFLAKHVRHLFLRKHVQIPTTSMYSRRIML